MALRLSATAAQMRTRPELKGYGEYSEPSRVSHLRSNFRYDGRHSHGGRGGPGNSEHGGGAPLSWKLLPKIDSWCDTHGRIPGLLMTGDSAHHRSKGRTARKLAPSYYTHYDI